LKPKTNTKFSDLFSYPNEKIFAKSLYSIFIFILVSTFQNHFQNPNPKPKPNPKPNPKPKSNTEIFEG
jgi:hypothetical protein